MADDNDRLSIQAAALLRGDLPDLRPETFGHLDHAIDQAMAGDDQAEAARLLREIADVAHLGPRLRAIERELSDGPTPSHRDAQDAGGFQGPPGDPGPGAATVWACPQPPPGHFRRRQRIPGQDMGVCSKHQVPLVRE